MGRPKRPRKPPGRPPGPPSAQQEYMRAWFRRHPGYCTAKSRERKSERLDWKRRLVEMSGGKCVDCGWSGLLCVFDFDHRDPATKTKAVTQMLKGAAWETVVAEVAKCDLVCANCHRVRTHIQRLHQCGAVGRTG